MTGRVRRAGSRWRLLVHEAKPRGGYGRSFDIRSHPAPRAVDATWTDEHVHAGTEFDELVVGRWLHIEQMDSSTWWMNLGGLTVHVTADRDGRPTRVHVGEVDDPVDGCVYELDDPA